MSLLARLFLASVMAAVTIGVRLAGLTPMLTLLRRHRSQRRRVNVDLHEGIGIVTAAIGLFALHAIEIWAYAALYVVGRALRDLEEALYFSTSTYATIGYGDIVLAPGWRVLGAIGVILLGGSTAFFVAVVSRIRLLGIEIASREALDHM